MMIRIWLFAAIIIPFTTFSQNINNVDSLKNLTENNNDTIAISASIELAKLYANNNFEEARKHIDHALKKSKNINYKKGEADAYHYTGLVEYYQGLRFRSLDNFLKALKIREEITDKPGIASSSNMVGLIYKNQKNYDKALEYFFICLKIRKETKDSKGISSCYNNIGLAFQLSGDLEKGLEYYLKALEIAKNNNEKHGIAFYYNNIGKIYYEQNKYGLSLEYFLQSMKIRTEINDLQGLTNVYTDIGFLYIETDNIEKALEFLSQSYLIAKEINIIHEIQEAAEGLSKAYYRAENFQKAYDYFTIYQSLTDSLSNQQVSEKLVQIELQTKYEKEKEIEELKQAKVEAENKRTLEKERSIRNILILGSLAFLAITIILYRNYRIKKRDNLLLKKQKREIEDKNEMLMHQKEEIETQRDEIEAQRDFAKEQRDQIASQNKEIVSSIEYARKIQKAVITSNDDFKKVLPRSFVFFKPRDIVSGDFYFVSKKNDRVILAVADCTGHGVPGAFMSILGLTFFNDVVNEKGITRPNVILNNVREQLVKALKQTIPHENIKITDIRDGMDVSVVSINVKTKTLEFAGANNPLYIVKNGDTHVEEIKADKMPVGFHARMNEPFNNNTISINEGDSIYLFTDGFADQFGGPKNKKFKYKMFKQLLIWSSSKIMNEQCAAIDKTFHEWKGEQDQVDDILIVGVKL